MPGTKGNTGAPYIDEQEARDQLAWWEVSTSRDADRVVHYVEAEVPLPSSVTVKGNVARKGVKRVRVR